MRLRLIRKFINRLVLPLFWAEAFPSLAEGFSLIGLKPSARLGDNCRYASELLDIFLINRSRMLLRPTTILERISSISNCGDTIIDFYLSQFREYRNRFIVSPISRILKRVSIICNFGATRIVFPISGILE